MAVFSKLLTNTDIEKRLAIPAKILPSLPDFDGSHAVEIQLMYGTKMWPIVCTVRKKGYKKPVFSGGWREFVVCNKLSVDDRLTLYKVHDETGSYYYQVQVQKPAKPSGLDVTNTGTSRTRACNFDNEQDKVLVEADAPIKQEQAMPEFADVAADWPVSFLDHFSPKPPIRMFGTIVSDEVTGKAHFKTEQESKMKFLGTCMCEASLHPYYMTDDEIEIKFSGLVEGSNSAIPYTTNQAVGDETLSLDLILGQSITPYAGIVNLDLTLAPPIVDRGQ